MKSHPTRHREQGKTRLLHLTTVDLSLRFLLGDQLEAFRDAGFEVVTASAPGPWVQDLEQVGIAHLAVSLRRSWSPVADLRAFGELVRIFRTSRPTIVHTHTPKAGALGRIAARVAGVPIVVNTIHGYYGAGSALRRSLVLLLERIAARCSDFELSQSREDLEHLRSVRVLDPTRSAYLGNGVNLGRFDPVLFDRNVVRAELGIPPEAVAVGMVGRLVWEKGYGEFFAMAERLQHMRVPVRAIVIGPHEPGKPDAIPAQVMDDLSIRGVAKFLGMRTDMPALYRAMDIFVLPSYREGFPRSAIEAAAMGLPLVLTDIRGCREVVAEGINGFLVPTRNVDALVDRVQRLVADVGLRGRFGTESRRRALAEFDEARVIRETLLVYRRLLHKKLGWQNGYRPESAAAG